GLIAHFRTMLSTMRGPSSSSPQIRTLSTGLARLEAIIVDSGNLSEEGVNQLRNISRAMLEEYYFEKPETSSATDAPKN
ncbi:MAG TPA: hypothetical protein PK648_14190, partial [Verrucomicrobiales bacterium]|nr:hypothetical protein [Verrucomicrobiales bacterium]